MFDERDQTEKPPEMEPPEMERRIEDLEARIERLLRGSDMIDQLVSLQLSASDWQDAPHLHQYFRGLYNGLLLAQKTLQNQEYNPL